MPVAFGMFGFIGITSGRRSSSRMSASSPSVAYPIGSVCASAPGNEVLRLVEQGAQLVEVLPREEYEDEHITGAINIPLKELNRETTARLDRAAPVLVYCHDYL